ncbi:hypothetical protein [Legionella sp. WA2022007384]
MADTTNCQDSGPVENNSTQSMMQALSNDSKASASTTEFVNRLKRLNLGVDERMIRLLSDHPDYGNRLISLFKMLKAVKIPMTSELELIISNNISCVGGAVNLLGLIKELDIDSQAISLDRLFEASRFDANVAQSARELHQQRVLDLATFELLLDYPEQSLEISRLLINLQEHAYNVESLVERLWASSISKKHMGATLDLLNLMLENDSYYTNAIDIFLRQEKYISKIYEGAKKLVAEHYPLCSYFELVENNPQNANVFAKNILLLHQASLVDLDSADDLSMVSKLGVGAFHFMKHLQLAGMLNVKNIEKICQPNNILEQDAVVQRLISLPLITKFENEELERMLELLDNDTVSKEDIELFNEILEEHFIANICAPSASYK